MSEPDCNAVCNADCAEVSANELGPNGPTVHEAVAGAVDALMSQPTRAADGTFVEGHAAALVTGERSEQLAMLLEPARREIIARTLVGLAVESDEASEPLRRLIEAHAEVSLLREALFAQIERLKGPVTGKGKLRALLAAHLKLVDRELRLAVAIGLERRSRPIDPLDRVRRAVEEANGR